MSESGRHPDFGQENPVSGWHGRPVSAYKGSMALAPARRFRPMIAPEFLCTSTIECDRFLRSSLTNEMRRGLDFAGGIRHIGADFAKPGSAVTAAAQPRLAQNNGCPKYRQTA